MTISSIAVVISAGVTAIAISPIAAIVPIPAGVTALVAILPTAVVPIASREVRAASNLTIQGGKVTDDSIVRMGRRIRDVAQMADGSLLFLTDGDDAELLRLTPAADTGQR